MEEGEEPDQGIRSVGLKKAVVRTFFFQITLSVALSSTYTEPVLERKKDFQL